MRRSRKKLAFNQKLVIDTIGAGIMVGLAPTLLNRFLFSSNPISGMTATAAGVAANWFLAQMLGRPDMANAGIGFGLVKFVEPVANDLLGLGKPIESLPVVAPTKPAIAGAPQQEVQMYALDEYGRLNEYISQPRQMNYQAYTDSY